MLTITFFLPELRDFLKEHILPTVGDWPTWYFQKKIICHARDGDDTLSLIGTSVRPICRPGENQRVVYNGHKRVHALSNTTGEDDGDGKTALNLGRGCHPSRTDFRS